MMEDADCDFLENGLWNFEKACEIGKRIRELRESYDGLWDLVTLQRDPPVVRYIRHAEKWTEDALRTHYSLCSFSSIFLNSSQLILLLLLLLRLPPSLSLT